MTNPLTVFVTGATGQQGGAVAHALLARGHKVRALTRNSSSDAAKALAAAGVDVREGDFNDPATLTAAATGVDTAFVMSTPFEAGEAAETKQGIAAIDAVKAAGVGHVIYSSVASADKQTGIPHFDSKYIVEQHLAASGVNYTIAAPVWFMDNLVAPWMVGSLRDGNVAIALDKTKPLQQVAVEDIGAFVASLVERRAAVFGKRYDIAGDELTGEALTKALSKATGTEPQLFRRAARHGSPAERGPRQDVRLVRPGRLHGRHRGPAPRLSRREVAPLRRMGGLLRLERSRRRVAGRRIDRQTPPLQVRRPPRGRRAPSIRRRTFARDRNTLQPGRFLVFRRARGG